MRSFKQFLTEVGWKSPYAGGTQYSGFFNLPDLKNLHQPGERPVGGFPNIAGAVQGGIERSRYGISDDYIIRDTLEKIRALVENVYSAIELRNQQAQYGPLPHSKAHEKNYEMAQYDGRLIHGLPKHEIVGGNYPRLRHEEVARGEKMGIIFPDPNDPTNFWAIDIEKLRTEMSNLYNRLHSQERQQQIVGSLAGLADKAVDAAVTPTGLMQRFHP